MTENERLYELFIEANNKHGMIPWGDMPNEKEQSLQRGKRLGFFELRDFTFYLTEKSQKVLDANGDFSVVDEQPTSVNVTASNAHIGNNSGTYHQDSSHSNNSTDNQAPKKTPAITKILIAAIGGFLGGLALWYVVEKVL